MSKGKSLVSVKVIKGDINRALKKYKRLANESGHLLELRERKTYTKPKTIRRKQKLDAARRNEREVLFQKWQDGDNTITIFNKKTKKQKNSNKKSEKPIENYGLKLER